MSVPQKGKKKQKKSAKTNIYWQSVVHGPECRAEKKIHASIRKPFHGFVIFHAIYTTTVPFYNHQIIADYSLIAIATSRKSSDIEL